MQGPRIPAVERMGSVVACRTVGNGTEGGSRDQNPTAILMLDRVQLETGGIGKEGLNMARGSSHLVLTIEHFWHSMFWVHLSDQTCTEVAGEPNSGEPTDNSMVWCLLGDTAGALRVMTRHDPLPVSL